MKTILGVFFLTVGLMLLMARPVQAQTTVPALPGGFQGFQADGKARGYIDTGWNVAAQYRFSSSTLTHSFAAFIGYNYKVPVFIVGLNLGGGYTTPGNTGKAKGSFLGDFLIAGGTGVFSAALEVRATLANFPLFGAEGKLTLNFNTFEKDVGLFLGPHVDLKDLLWGGGFQVGYQYASSSCGEKETSVGANLAVNWTGMQAAGVDGGPQGFQHFVGVLFRTVMGQRNCDGSSIPLL